MRQLQTKMQGRGDAVISDARKYVRSTKIRRRTLKLPNSPCFQKSLRKTIQDYIFYILAPSFPLYLTIPVFTSFDKRMFFEEIYFNKRLDKINFINDKTKISREIDVIPNANTAEYMPMLQNLPM